MPANKRLETNSGKMAGPSTELPLDLVATIAGRFVTIDPEFAHLEKWQGVMGEAVQKAIDLVERCKAEIVSHGRTQGRLDLEKSELKKWGWGESERVPFSQAIKFITSQRRHDRALKLYEAFFRTFTFRNKPRSGNEVAAGLKKLESSGFEANELHWLRKFFELSKDVGLLGKNWRRALKKLDKRRSQNCRNG